MNAYCDFPVPRNQRLLTIMNYLKCLNKMAFHVPYHPMVIQIFFSVLPLSITLVNRWHKKWQNQNPSFRTLKILRTNIPTGSLEHFIKHVSMLLVLHMRKREEGEGKSKPWHLWLRGRDPQAESARPQREKQQPCEEWTMFWPLSSRHRPIASPNWRSPLALSQLQDGGTKTKRFSPRRNILRTPFQHFSKALSEHYWLRSPPVAIELGSRFKSSFPLVDLEISISFNIFIY